MRDVEIAVVAGSNFRRRILVRYDGKGNNGVDISGYAYEVRLTEAIDFGWLLPFHYFGIADATVDFLQIPWRNLKAVESALSVESRVEQVSQHALERGYDGDRRATVGFCAGRAHALYMAEQFRRRGHTAEAVLGDVPVSEREAT